MELARHTPEMVQRYMKMGYWTEELMCDRWDRCAREYPDREAIADSATRMTYAEAKQWVDRVALGLHQMGINRDDAIMGQLPNKVDAFLSTVAMEKIGVPLGRAPATLRHKEMLYILKLIRAVGILIQPVYHNFNYYNMVQDIRPELPDLKYVFVLGDETPLPGTISLNELARKAPGKLDLDKLFSVNKVKPGEAGILKSTSGTTGLPKVIAAPPPNTRFFSVFGQRWQMSQNDVIACIAPFYGGGGYISLEAPMYGAKLVLVEKSDTEDVLRVLEKERATVAATVPAQMALIVRHPNLKKYDLSSLRIMYYSGSPCAYSLAEEVEEKLGCRVMALYGQTEGGPMTTTSFDDPPEVRRISAGKLLPGVEVRLVDENGKEVPQGGIGEMLTRGAQASSQFVGDPSGTRDAWGDEPDSWLHTGDMCRFDKEGNLFIVGRAKELIIRGGQNIYPKEVEDMLITHPKILNVAIVAMPDPIMGEKCCAYVITRPGEILTFEEMIAFLKTQQMASFKLPERLEIVDKFPMGEGQKILKRELAADVARKLKAEGTIP